ncbi:MAG: TRAP transporter small permease subunit [Rubrivivax sp.]|nr:TRAP transporter small permease subunit [Rubrivivax sp.]
MRRLLGAWHRAECAIAVGAFGLIALLLVVDVAGREFLQPLLQALGVDAGPMGLYGAQKMAVFALVLATYAGIGIATASAAHLVPQVAFGLVPARWSGAMNHAADALSGVLLLAAATYSAELVIGSYTTGLRAPMLQWFVWPVQLALPAGFASAAVRYVCYACWPALRPRRAEAAP